MNSIRPLVTIALLVCVGGYLYLKINEGPVRPAGGGGAQEIAEGVPPLGGLGAPAAGRNAPATNGTPAATNAAPAGGGAAPAWSPPPLDNAPTNETAPAKTETDSANLPPVPTIPELPDVAPLPDAPAHALQPTVGPPAPTQLPADIPVARYPGEPAPSGTTDAAARSPAAPSPSAPSHDLPDYAPPAGALAAAELLPHANDLAAPPTTPDAASPPPAVSGAVDRYGQPVADRSSANGAATASAAIVPAESSFAESWPVIQTALERRELARAHKLLSQWYGDASLAPHEAQQLETLLSQLAGTVVYSTEHHVEPAHVVQPGETLQTIAEKYRVPWQLLAKINGIPAADAVEPGQQLKVVRGPFSAVVDLSRGELTLMLDGRYAGKFAVSAPPAAIADDGEWTVVDRFDSPHDGKLQRALVLRTSDATNGAAHQGVLLGAVPVERLKQLGVALEAPVVGLGPVDAEEVADILSVGSRVVIRR